MHSLWGEAQQTSPFVSHISHVYRHVDDEELTDRADFLAEPANYLASSSFYVRQSLEAFLTNRFFDERAGVKNAK
jgi:hypothetical protein